QSRGDPTGAVVVPFPAEGHSTGAHARLRFRWSSWDIGKVRQRAVVHEPAAHSPMWQLYSFKRTGWYEREKATHLLTRLLAGVDIGTEDDSYGIGLPRLSIQKKGNIRIGRGDRRSLTQQVQVSRHQSRRVCLRSKRLLNHPNGKRAQPELYDRISAVLGCR